MSPVAPPDVPQIRTVRTAALSALKANGVLPSGIGGRVYDGTVPPTPALPYLVVYGGGASRFDGTMTEPQADADQLVQLTCVGGTPDEAEGLIDRALAALLPATAWDIDGRAVSGPPSIDTLRPTMRDTDAGEPARWFTVLILRIPTTPA